jgi:hypothetical protein
MSVPHNPPTAIRGHPIDVAGEKIRHLGLDRPREQRTRPLTQNVGERIGKANEIAALKAATGLLPFLAWISADDHYDDTNLVVDDLGDGHFRVMAIDFEHAFHWGHGEDAINADSRLVEKYLEIIEGLTAVQITDCCVAAGFKPEFGRR